HSQNLRINRPKRQIQRPTLQKDYSLRESKENEREDMVNRVEVAAEVVAEAEAEASEIEDGRHHGAKITIIKNYPSVITAAKKAISPEDAHRKDGYKILATHRQMQTIINSSRNQMTKQIPLLQNQRSILGKPMQD